LCVIEEALSRNHTVTIFARNPSKLPSNIATSKSVSIVEGSLSDREAVVGGLVCHEIAPLSLRVSASIIRDAARTGRDPLSGVALSALTAVLPVTFCQRLMVTST